MEQRLKVLKDLETLPIAVTKKYNVSGSTIRKIRQNVVKMMDFASKPKVQKERQRMKKPVYEELEYHLLMWFRKKRATEDFIPDAMLLARAAELRDALGLCSNVKVRK